MSEVKSVFSLEDLGIRLTEEQLVAPSGGEDFGGGQLIAPFKTGKMYMFMSRDSLVEYNSNETEQLALPDLSILRSGGDWHAYYYYSYAKAKTAFDTSLGDGSRDEGFEKPSYVWAVWAETASILNANESLIERSGAVFVREARLQVLRIGRKQREGKTSYPLNNRHEWNFVAEPCMVAAVADLAGIKNTGYDIEDLVSNGIDHTEERFAALCGDVHGHYKDSELYARRAKLWASLGEDDARKDLPTGSKTVKGKPHKLATEATALSSCLGVICGIWDNPLWARLVTVPNPYPGAVNDETDRQRTIPAIVEFFHTEADARAAAAELVEENGGTVAPAHPPLPKNWTGKDGGEKVLVEWLKKYFADPANVNKPPNIQAGEGELYMDSVDLMNQWKTYAGIK